MEERHYLFDPLIGEGVIQNYSIDVLKVLIEDKEWSESILMSLDANDFNLCDFRVLIGGLQDYFYKKGTVPDYDVLVNYMFGKDCEEGLHIEPTNVDKEMYLGYVNECKSKVLTEDRINQIKTSLPLFSRYILLAKIANLAIDGHRDGYSTKLKFEDKCDRVIELAAKLKMLKDSEGVKPNTVDNWC